MTSELSSKVVVNTKEVITVFDTSNTTENCHKIQSKAILS